MWNQAAPHEQYQKKRENELNEFKKEGDWSKTFKVEHSYALMSLAFKNSYFSNYSLICMEIKHE